MKQPYYIFLPVFTGIDDVDGDQGLGHNKMLLIWSTLLFVQFIPKRNKGVD